ncbi:MAG TPA: NUDIX domain-containing protein [Gaiellales bacterium]|nr:NUDIX domain-containing protein [Gaiellales bacterium]
MGDGDGWVQCALGHRHWGRFGAAGLLVNDDHDFVLQHRAPWTHEGGTWGLPGGARDSHEDVVSSALREAKEEADIEHTYVAPVALTVDDHGGWSYTTVAAHPRTSFEPRSVNAESTEIRWWPEAGIDHLPLHPGFARTWPHVRHPVRPLTLIVDTANVVGSRPDGWWRDRLGATRRLRDELAPLVRDGLPVHDLPAGADAGRFSVMLPRVTLVVEGAARRIEDDPVDDAPPWWVAAVRVHASARDGDTDVVRLAADSTSRGEQVFVVSADRELRSRLDRDITAVSPSWLLARLAGAGAS